MRWEKILEIGDMNLTKSQHLLVEQNIDQLVDADFKKKLDEWAKKEEACQEAFFRDARTAIGYQYRNPEAVRRLETECFNAAYNQDNGIPFYENVFDLLTDKWDLIKDFL